MIPVSSERDKKLIRYLSVLRGHTISFCQEDSRNEQPFNKLTEVFRLFATQPCFVTAKFVEEPQRRFYLTERTVYFFKGEGDQEIYVVQDENPGKLYITELI